MMRFLERRADAVAVALRLVLGWHLAYLGVWALVSPYTFSWAGRFRCAHWLGGEFFYAVANASAMGVLDLVFAWGLLLAGLLLLFGRWIKGAALFGIVYLALMYVVNPPHFGHTGESHFLYIDRNVIEVFMLAWLMCGKKADDSESEEAA